MISSFTGRLLVSAIFIASGVTKLAGFHSGENQALMAVVEPKLTCFISGMERVPALETVPFEVITENASNLVFAAGIMEVLGALLFLLDFSFGASLLMLFLIGVTPVMHNFWDPKCYGADQVAEMINFMKNLAIFGGLLAYVSKVGRYQKNKYD